MPPQHDPELLRERMQFMARDESGAELLARCYVAPLHLGVPAVDAHAPLRPGNVLEATGASGCAKTELLVQAAVTCILPPRADGVEYGGHGGALPDSRLSSTILITALGGVLYLDLDGKLDAARLPLALSRRVLAAREAAGAPPGRTSPCLAGGCLCAPDDPVYAASLAAFRLLRCRSSAALVRAAAALDRLVAPPPPAGGWQEEPPATRLLLIDNLGAHFWQEKAVRFVPLAAQSAGGAAFDRSAKLPALDWPTVHGALAAAVHGAARRHRLVVIATKHSFGSPSAPPTQAAQPPGALAAAPRGGRPCVPGPVYREYMAKAWQDVVTHRLTLYKPDPSLGRVLAHWAAPLQYPAGVLLADDGPALALGV